MDDHELKQLCISVSKAALELYDIIDEKGITAPIDNMGDLSSLKNLIENSEKIRRYYFRRTTQRMLALGVSPKALLEMADDG